MNPKLKDQEPFNPGTGDYDRYDRSLSTEENLLNGLWVRPNPEPAEVFDIRRYAMTFDGYGYAERFLEEKNTLAVFRVADEIRNDTARQAVWKEALRNCGWLYLPNSAGFTITNRAPGWSSSSDNSAGNYLVILNQRCHL